MKALPGPARRAPAPAGRSVSGNLIGLGRHEAPGLTGLAFPLFFVLVAVPLGVAAGINILYVLALILAPAVLVGALIWRLDRRPEGRQYFVDPDAEPRIRRSPAITRKATVQDVEVLDLPRAVTAEPAAPPVTVNVERVSRAVSR